MTKAERENVGPTPAQIAERAYNIAIGTALIAVGLNPTPDVASVKAHMEAARSIDLAALRESIVNPSVIPWWSRK